MKLKTFIRTNWSRFGDHTHSLNNGAWTMSEINACMYNCTNQIETKALLIVTRKTMKQYYSNKINKKATKWRVLLEKKKMEIEHFSMQWYRHSFTSFTINKRMKEKNSFLLPVCALDGILFVLFCRMSALLARKYFFFFMYAFLFFQRLLYFAWPTIPMDSQIPKRHEWELM